jgi:3-deoxy-D-arabino-heptulosonate 7-phosphate (DAHP) synthase
MKNEDVTIIAGPCSIDDRNVPEIYEIADMTITDRNGARKKAIAGTRIVGIKSRTELDSSGSGMGVDYSVYRANMEMLQSGGCVNKLEVPPSVAIAEEVYKKTGMMIATEIMTPILQLPQYEGRIPAKRLMPWNPAVEQLGWPVLQTADLCRRNGWHIGIKNGKWVGEHIRTSNSEDYAGQTTMEKTWVGLTKYAAGVDGDIVLIHRGVDVPDKGEYRNAPVHHIARRAKKSSGAKLFFDPSHAFGPKMREHIVYAVIDAMRMKVSPDEYLYDGILIETGTSTTDTEQHITIDELRELVTELAAYRDPVSPNELPA